MEKKKRKRSCLSCAPPRGHANQHQGWRDKVVCRGVLVQELKTGGETLVNLCQSKAERRPLTFRRGEKILAAAARLGVPGCTGSPPRCTRTQGAI